AGAAALRFMDALLTDPSLGSVLVVGAFRDSEIGAAHPLAAMRSRWQRLGIAPLEIELHNLPPGSLAALIGKVLALAPPQAAELAQAVAGHSRGNPFDTLEVLNALRRDGLLEPGPQGWRWDSNAIRRYLGHGDVTRMLVERFARLPSESRQLLEVVVCLGGRAEGELLKAAAGVDAS